MGRKRDIKWSAANAVEWRMRRGWHCTQSAINLMLICIVAFVGLSAREVVGLWSPAMMIRIIKHIERPDDGLLAAYDAARSH